MADGIHPAARADLLGREAAERDFAEAIASGRLHHAWLIGGPEGTGKATLAYRVARRLLARPEEVRPDLGPLAVDPGGRTFRQVEAGSHPNLLVLDLDRASMDVDKPPARTIGVKTVRRALAFFGSTSADGGHRVCIVDAAEDLLPAGANALLKTVEEPPSRATILIVSHAPQRVLPTIRSRCRKLVLPPLGEDDVATILAGLPAAAGADPATVARAAALGEGSVSRALALLEPARLSLLDEVAGVLDQLPFVSHLRVLRIGDKLADRKGEDDLPLVLDTVRAWVATRIRDRVGQGAASLAPLAELCERIDEAARSVDTYNLDRRPFIVGMFTDLAEAVGRAA